MASDDELIEQLRRVRDRLDKAKVPDDMRLIWPPPRDKLSHRNRGEPAMSDTNAAYVPPAGSGYPVAQSTAVPAVEPRALTPEEQAQCDELYDELKPMATDSARQYVLARTPANLQEAMAAKIDADWPLPPAEDPAVLASRREDLLSAFRPATPRSLDPAPDPATGSYGPPVYDAGRGR